MKKSVALGVILAAGLALAGCNARRDFPPPNIGSHSPSYNVVFGRLAKVLPADGDADAAPLWIVRFGYPQDAYQGELALTGSPGFIVGYSGGEPVELRGRLLDRETRDAYNGRWYVVDSIQLWSGYRQ